MQTNTPQRQLSVGLGAQSIPLLTEIETELYQKLTRAGIIKSSPSKLPRAASDKKTPIDIETSQMLESGIALAQYLIVTKDTLKRRGLLDIKVDTERLRQLKQSVGPQNKLFNWNIIIHELDKIGVKVESNTKVVGGDPESIIQLFRAVDQAVKKVTGQTLEFEESTIDSSGTLGHNGSMGKSRKRQAKDGVDILSMKVDKTPEETESSLEFILNTLCRALAMKPKQAAALMTNNNQFLIHSIVKGVKGNYEPLNAWYNEIKLNIQQLIALLEIETEQLPKLLNIPKVLGTLSCGLFSQNIDICRHSIEILNTMNKEFSLNPVMFGQAHIWVVEKEGGIDLTLQALKRHSDLAGDFIDFVSQFSSIMKQPIDRMYKDQFRKLFQEPNEYINVINDIFPYLVKHMSIEVRESGLLDYWIDISLEQAGLDAQKSNEERMGAITLLSEIWYSYTDYVDQKADRLGFIQQVIKKAGRDKNRNLRIVAVSLMFRLLEKFAQEKNSSAPSLYKALIFSLIENPSDFILREHYLVNFQYLFENQQSIPLNLLLDPLIKQINISENVSYFYKTFDFDFFTTVAHHPKLFPATAVSLADLLAKIYLNDASLASSASVPLMLLCSRFNLDEAMQDFIVKFETVCLAGLMNLEKNGEELQAKHQALIQEQQELQARAANLNKKGQPLALPAPPAPVEFEHKHGKPTKRMTKEEMARQQREQERDTHRRLRKSQIIQVLLKLQNLKHDELNEQLRELLLSSNRRFCKKLYGYYNKGIMTLLRYWGDAENLMAEYMRENDEREEFEKRDIEEKEQMVKAERERLEKQEKQQVALRRYGEEMSKLRQSMANGATLSNDEERRLLLWDENGEADLMEGDQIRDSMALMLYNGSSRFNAATLRNQKAIQQIEKIARTKVEQEEQKRLDEERLKLASQRRKKKLKDVLDKRKLELGVGPKLGDAQAQDLAKEQLIFDDGDLLQKQESDKLKKLMGKMASKEIKLLILDEEEDRDQEAVKLMMKKYGKLWKNLYYKYSNSGFNSKNVANFDQYNEKSQTISLGEATKMLKDHNTFPSLIDKEELQSLFKLVNISQDKRNDLQAMDFQAFQTFILQLAYFCFTREPKNLSHLPIVETVKALIKQFEDATRARGNSTVLYEDPDSTSASDAKLIKALNEKLLKEPQYPIPEGFTKQLERTPVFDYAIPKTIASQMKESKVAAVEMLDWLLSEKFGFHILEPMVKYEERLKVKPSIKNPAAVTQSAQAEALNYMRKVEKRGKPEQNSLNPYASMSALDKLKTQQEVKPELSVALRLEVAKEPVKTRPHVQEVAEVLEELLQGAEKGLKTLPARANRAPGQVWNEAKQKKEDDQRKDSDLKFQKEDKRKKRDEQLKNELVKLKEIKVKEDAEKKLKDEAAKKKKSEAQKVAEEVFKKKLAERISKEEEEKKKQREAAALDGNKVGGVKKASGVAASVDLEKARTERREFLRKQKERMSQQFSQVLKEREDIVKKEEVMAAKEKELQVKIRQVMEVHMKETAQDRGKEQRERQQINDFLALEDVQSVFFRYDQALRQMYRFYASQDKKDVGFNLEKAMNSMNMRELVKFAYQQLIIPTLLQPDDIVQIFRYIMRERNEQVQASIADKEDNYLIDKNFAQILDFDQFKKALVRIATLAATDQHQGGINERIDRETAIKKKGKRPTDTSVDLSEEQSKSLQSSPLKRRVASINRDIGATTLANQRSRSQMKVGQKAPTTQTEGGTTESTTQAQTSTINALTNSLRMSKEVKILRALEEKEQHSNSILASGAKIEKDRKVRKEFNVNLIQAKTIEALLRFLELEPSEKPQDLDHKLNQHRIEIQGQKPTRLRKQLKNNRLEDYIQELPLEEEQLQLEGASRNNPSILEDGEVNQHETQEY